MPIQLVVLVHIPILGQVEQQLKQQQDYLPQHIQQQLPTTMLVLPPPLQQLLILQVQVPASPPTQQ